MNIKQVEYSKVFNLGNYSNEKIGVVIDITENDNVVDVIAEAKKQVEEAHGFFREYPQYEHAQHIVKNVDDYTGRQVSDAQAGIEKFEKKYKDYLTRMTASRTLTVGTLSEDE